MTILRTPDERFAGLPGFSFAPHYLDDLTSLDGVRIHYLDEGPKDAEHTYLCLHGEPTWCYLYRKMIPVFTGAGGRVVAPDFAGFGRSDKPADDGVYTFHFHRDMLLALIRRLDLKNITLVVQDWGGLLGLTLPMAMTERFSRLIIMNTALATGTTPSEGFLQWRAYVAANPDLAVGGLMKRSCPQLTDAEVAAYDAPFPDISFKAGVRRFPAMVMTEPDMEGVTESRQAADFWRKDWVGSSFMAIGARDPVLGVDVMQSMRSLIRGCPEPMILEDAGHFVQESGDTIASAALDAFAD
ncbi:MAG: haloalkane dehalogenase [Rhizobiaceae bacterium]